MNKPLTIEELKALKEDDWIYIKDLEFGNDFYATVTDTYLGESAKYINIASAGWYQEFWFESYGTEWLAYKNKEEAVGEYDSRVKEAKKQTAKEILDGIYCAVNRFLDDDTLEYIFDSQYKKYGVEVDK